MEERTETDPSPRRKRPLFLRLLLGTAATVGLFLAVPIALKWVWDARYFTGYDRSLPLEASILEEREWEGHIRQKIRFQAEEGAFVPALFHLPKEPTEKAPCVVLLYGIGQKMAFLDDIASFFVRDGIAIICPEQLGQGERKPSEKASPLQGMLRLRERGRTTVTEARRTLDYLETRPEIDSGRSYLLGISLGAILGTSAVALDPRYKGAILMWGGGDFKRMFTRNETAGQNLKWYQKLLAGWGASFLKPADPMLRIQLISPRPLLFQNALQDEIIPRECTEAYYEKAREPKQILWYDCGHEKGLTEELIRKIVGDQVSWLKRLR